MREQQRCGAKVRARGALRRAEADERRGQHEHCRRHGERGRHRLRVEEVGDDQEVAEEHRHGGVAVGARFEQLQPREQHQEQDPGLAAEEGAELEPDREHRDRRHAEHQPARRQRSAVDAEVRAPAVQAQREQRQPPGGAHRVRGDDQEKRREQPGHLAQAERAMLRCQRVDGGAHVIR
jgi:hypothetical protein